MMRYHRARYYHPQLRRFLNQDVLLGSIVGPSSLNRFAYANDNPVSLVDPLGLWQITVGGGAGLGIQFTIGNNGGSGSTNGQWNFGVHFGVGEGAYVNVDPSNSGYHEQGNVGSVEGTGGIGLGPNVETSAHIEGIFDTSNNSWDASYSVPGVKGLSIPIGGEGSEPPHVKTPTWGFGEGAFVGIGINGYFNPPAESKKRCE